MRSIARVVVLAGLSIWQTAACWAIGPMGFSEPPSPTPALASAEPSGPMPPSSVAAPPPLIPTADMSSHDPDASGFCGCQSCCGHKLGSKLLIGVFCNMPQHYAYPSPWDRYYYFRPYNYFQIPQLQQTVAGWGQDPRNISDNRFFQAIYDQVDPSGDPTPDRPATGSQPKLELVPPPTMPAPTAKPIDQGRHAPPRRQPPVGFSRQKKTVAPVSRAVSPATKPPRHSDSTAAGPPAPQLDAKADSQLELIRFVMP